MTLDLEKVLPQLEGMVSSLEQKIGQRQEKLGRALETLQLWEGKLPALRGKIAQARTTWLVAGIGEALGRGYPLPPCPEDWSVLASDGSHLATDRHAPVQCYLINTGTAYLRYGSSPGARLESRPALCFQPEELVLRDPNGNRDLLVEGILLGLKRLVAEMEALAQALPSLDPALPLLCLMDGSLVMWGLEAFRRSDFVKETLLEKGFLVHLGQLRQEADRRPLALASYISQPGSTEVVNALKVALCPYEPVDCDRWCRWGERACSTLDGVEDRVLFSSLLQPQERSPLFASTSSVLRGYGEHAVSFFYLGGGEVVRVEVPGWVARDPARLSLVHSLVYGQCLKGGGYPVALMEAHQQAVVTAADREGFWMVVESLLSRRGIPFGYSPKRISKRLPWA